MNYCILCDVRIVWSLVGKKLQVDEKNASKMHRYERRKILLFWKRMKQWSRREQQRVKIETEINMSNNFSLSHSVSSFFSKLDSNGNWMTIYNWKKKRPTTEFVMNINCCSFNALHFVNWVITSMLVHAIEQWMRNRR